MRLIAIRHGETEWNVERREMGHLDSPLTPRGLLQAERIATRLRTVKFDRLYSSDLRRAMTTAGAISDACGVPVIPHAGLRERNLGIFQGMTRAEQRVRFPEEFAQLRQGEREYVIPQGESGAQRTERSVKTLTAIAGENSGGQVVVVTHVGFLLGFFEYVLALPPGGSWRYKRRNASFSSFTYEQGKWSLDTWNDTSHLDGMEALDDPLSATTPIPEPSAP